MNGVAVRSQADAELCRIARFNRIEILFAVLIQELVTEIHGIPNYRHSVVRISAEKRILVFRDKRIASRARNRTVVYLCRIFVLRNRFACFVIAGFLFNEFNVIFDIARSKARKFHP